MSNGWTESAQAWIADMGLKGDFGREFVLDAPMLERVEARGFKTALDVGCGEGRFCRMLRARCIQTIGVDPTEALIEHARREDPAGDYRIVISYLSLVDVPDLARAISEMVRVLEPGGTLLIANLTSFNTAGGWMPDGGGELRFSMDHYLDERVEWVGWRGIRIQNWHRPFSAYMALLLDQGLVLRHFAEPAPHGGDPAKADRYRRVPFFLIMEWEKPATAPKLLVER
jgi:SAM-dependent methyltransferase